MTIIVNESAESASKVARKGSDNVIVQDRQHGKVDGDHVHSDQCELPRYTLTFMNLLYGIAACIIPVIIGRKLICNQSVMKVSI